MWRWLSSAALASTILAGCGSARPAARKDDALAAPVALGAIPPEALKDPAAPLDPEIASLPHARGFWMTDEEYGRVYVVSVGPTRAPVEPTLFLVHGLGTNGMRDWYTVLAPLAEHRRVVMFDLPGFGHSAQANVKYGPARYAAVLSRVIARYGPGPVDVIGHSMGGAISLFHAASYPEQVRRLIVVDAAGILHRDAWAAHHVRRVTEPARIILPRFADILGEAADLFSDASRILDPAPDIVMELGPLRQKLLGGKPERIAALGLILQDFGPLIARIRAPTLVVWGGDDMIAPLRTGLMLADRLPDAQLVVFPGIGHQVMAQAPAQLVPQIEHHLTAPGIGPLRPPVVAGASQGKGICHGLADLHLTGTYDSVEIEDCAGVVLEQVHTTSLVIRRSTASVVRSTFTAGIVADASTLLITGGEIDGELALDIKDSRVDLAGVAIDARREPFRATGQSRLLLSVCPVRTPEGSGFRHGFVNVPVGPSALQ
jgi:pimeloyl-ACP methyl ester carboxylesterase